MDKASVLFDSQASLMDEMQQVSDSRDLQALSTEPLCILTPQYMSDFEQKPKRSCGSRHVSRKKEQEHVALNLNVAQPKDLSLTDSVAHEPKVDNVVVNSQSVGELVVGDIAHAEVKAQSSTAMSATLALEEAKTQLDQSPRKNRRRRKNADAIEAMPLLMGLEPDDGLDVSAKTNNNGLANSEVGGSSDDALSILMPQKQSEYEQALKAKALANARLAAELQVEPEEVYNPLAYCAELLAGVDVDWDGAEPDLAKLKDMDKSIAEKASEVASSQLTVSWQNANAMQDPQANMLMAHPAVNCLTQDMLNAATLEQDTLQANAQVTSNQACGLVTQSEGSCVLASNTKEACVLATNGNEACALPTNTNEACALSKAHSVLNTQEKERAQDNLQTVSNNSVSFTLSNQVETKGATTLPQSTVQAVEQTKQEVEYDADVEDRLLRQMAVFLLQKRSRQDFVLILSEVFQAQGYMINVCSEGHGIPEVDLLAVGGVFGLGGPKICIKLNYEGTPLRRSDLKAFQEIVHKYHADYGILLSAKMFKHKVKPLVENEFAKIEFWDMRKALIEITQQYNNLTAHSRRILPLEQAWVFA